MKNKLKIEKILDFVDVPQLFVARDSFDTRYLCMLYDDESVCRYSAIRISANRLDDFYQGVCDLRYLFLYPENTGEYFDVSFIDGEYILSLSNETSFSETKLPAEGYKLSADLNDKVIVNLPLKDHNLLTELVRKFGWACM
jgi:hypothetical protein